MAYKYEKAREAVKAAARKQKQAAAAEACKKQAEKHCHSTKNIIGGFFGLGINDNNEDVKKKLAKKLANGEIDSSTFNEAMKALK